MARATLPLVVLGKLPGFSSATRMHLQSVVTGNSGANGLNYGIGIERIAAQVRLTSCTTIMPFFTVHL